MAYTKQTWACGDEITAEKLNHIEDGIAEGDCGFECVEGYTTLTEESITVDSDSEGNTGEFYYQAPIRANSIRVTFDGVAYTLNKSSMEQQGGTFIYYGEFGQTGPDFTNYPFFVLSPVGGHNMIYTATAGTHIVKIEALTLLADTTECFNKAVQSAAVLRVPFKIPTDNELIEISTIPADDVDDALADGRIIYGISAEGETMPFIYNNGSSYYFVYIGGGSLSTVQYGRNADGFLSRSIAD